MQGFHKGGVRVLFFLGDVVESSPLRAVDAKP